MLWLILLSGVDENGNNGLFIIIEKRRWNKIQLCVYEIQW